MEKYVAMIVGGKIWVVHAEAEWKVVDVLLGTPDVFVEKKRRKKKDWDD